MKLKLALAFGVSALAIAGSAAAQEDPRDAVIRALTERLDTLEQQLNDLKESSAADAADVRRVVTEAPQVTVANARPTITASDGSKIAIRGLIQFDAADYREEPGNPTDLTSGTNFRRARLGVEGSVGKNWNYALTGEFGGTATESAVLNQGWIEYAGWKPWESTVAQPLRFRIGAWATPANLEDATNNTEGLFLERPAAAELTRAFAGGDGRTGIGVFANGERWYASGVLSGAVIGTANPVEFDEQVGYLARAAYLVSRSPDHAIHLGVNTSGVIEPADTAAGPAVTKQIRLRERPELRVDTTRLVDTGALNADGASQYGVELGGFYKNLYASAEAFRFDVHRTAGTPDSSFGGWYGQAAWTITGEQRQWVAASGGFRGIRPTKAFDPKNGGWGAWEIAGRYSVLDLNDNAGVAGAATPVGGIRGGEQRITTVGLNWYPNPVVRFLLDYQWVDIDRLNGAGAQVGEDIQAVSLRSQLSF